MAKKHSLMCMSPEVNLLANSNHEANTVFAGHRQERKEHIHKELFMEVEHLPLWYLEQTVEKECENSLKNFASMIAKNKNLSYASTLGCISKRLSFEITKSAEISVR